MKMCSIEDCGKPIKARTWCNMHYRRWRKHGDPLKALRVRIPRGPECTIDGCDNAPRTRGWCIKHYKRWTNHGDPLADVADRFEDREESFAARVAWDGAHLIWIGFRNNAEYGVIGWKATSSRLAHRHAWERINGPIPEGMYVDHICHTPACVLPDHLRLATHQQNGQNRSGPTRGRDLPRGVARHGSGYRVQVAGRRFGTYPTQEQAEPVAIAARSELFGAFAGGN